MTPSNTMWPGLRPTSIPSWTLIHPAVWLQQTWAEKWGAVVPNFLGRESCVPLLHNVAWATTDMGLPTKWHLVPSSRSQQTWAENWGLHLTQCGEAEAYLHAKFHLDPSNHLATTHQH